MEIPSALPPRYPLPWKRHAPWSMWESAYPLQLNRGGSTFTLTPAHCCLGISEEFSKSVSGGNAKSSTLSLSCVSSCQHQQRGFLQQNIQSRSKNAVMSVPQRLLTSSRSTESWTGDSHILHPPGEIGYFRRHGAKCAADKTQFHITNHRNAIWASCVARGQWVKLQEQESWPATAHISANHYIKHFPKTFHSPIIIFNLYDCERRWRKRSPICRLDLCKSYIYTLKLAAQFQNNIRLALWP